MKKIILFFVLIGIPSVSSAQFSFKFVMQPKTIGFQNTAVGDSAQRAITFTVDTSSPNDVDVTVSAPTTTNFVLRGKTSFTVKRGTTDTVLAVFKPTSIGTFRDTVFVQHNGDTTFVKNPQRVTMSAKGIAADTSPKITLNTQTLNFGTDSMGTVTQRTFSIINTSTDATKILTGTVGLPATAAYSITSGGGNFTINKGDTLKVTVTFTAPSKAGTYHDTLVVSSNSNPLTASLNVTMSATVPGPDTIARISVTPAQFLFFGSVSKGKTKQMPVKIANSTNVSLTLSGTSTIDVASRWYSIATGGGAFTLAKGDTQTVLINFTPDTIANFLGDSLIITSNSDPSHQRIKISLFGTGIAPDTMPRLALGGIGGPNGNTMNFGPVFVGAQSTKSFTITNTTDGITSQLTGSVSNPKLSQFVVSAGSGAYTLDPGKSQTISVTFSPTATAAISDTLFLTSNDTANKGVNSLIKIVLSGSGVISTTPIISFSTKNLDFGTVATGSSPKMLPFTIKNTSASALKLNFQMTYPLAPFTLASGGGSFSLDSGMTHTDTVILNPVIAGNYHDSIKVTSNTDASTSTVIIRMTAIVSSDRVSESPSVGNMAIFPNPASGKATLQFGLVNDQTVRAKIYDISGNVIKMYDPTVYSIGDHQLDLDLSGFANGTYYLRLELADGAKTLQFVVVK